MQLTSRNHPTCPLCRESVFLLETRSCEGCRTHYHQACLEEFTGCSTLGCASTTYVEAEFGRVESLSGQIRVSERPPRAPSRVWVSALRFGAALRSGVGGFLSRVRERISSLRLVEGVAITLLVGIFIMMAVLVCQGLSSLMSITLSEVVAFGLALCSLGAVVFAAHAVSSHS